MDMGFLSGADLKNRLSRDLGNPQETDLGRMVLRTLNGSRDDIRAFGHDLGVSQEPSIDAFLKQRTECLDIGRLAVWLCILEAERNALKKDITSYWLYRFLSRLFDGIIDPSKLDRPDSKGAGFEFLHGLTINTLNYDRLAEHTIITWMKNRFPNLDLVAGNYVSGLNPGGVVRHLHGSLGPVLGESRIDFGAAWPDDPQEAKERASRLVFWFEPTNSSQAYGRTNRIVELRGVHVVVGFGYHDMISNRFRPPESPDARLHRIIATSRDDCRSRAAQWLQSVYGQRSISINHLPGNATCEDAIRALF